MPLGLPTDWRRCILQKSQDTRLLPIRRVKKLGSPLVGTFHIHPGVVPSWVKREFVDACIFSISLSLVSFGWFSLSLSTQAGEPVADFLGTEDFFDAET